MAQMTKGAAVLLAILVQAATFPVRPSPAQVHDSVATAGPTGSRVLVVRPGRVLELYPNKGQLYWTEHRLIGNDGEHTVVGSIDLRTAQARTHEFGEGMHDLAMMQGRLFGFSDACSLQEISIERGVLVGIVSSINRPCLDLVGHGSALYYVPRFAEQIVFRVEPTESAKASRRKSAVEARRCLDVPRNGIGQLLVDGNTFYLAGFNEVYRIRGWRGSPEPIFRAPDRSGRLILAQNSETLFIGSDETPMVVAVSKKHVDRVRPIGEVPKLTHLVADERELFSASRTGEVRAWNIADEFSQVIETRDAITDIVVSDGRLFWVRGLTDAKGTLTGSQIMVSDRSTRPSPPPPTNRAPAPRSSKATLGGFPPSGPSLGTRPGSSPQ